MRTANRPPQLSDSSVYYMHINNTTQCMTCANQHIIFIKDVYHQAIWCKHKHQMIERMMLDKDCPNYYSDLLILYGEKIRDVQLRPVEEG